MNNPLKTTIIVSIILLVFASLGYGIYKFVNEKTAAAEVKGRTSAFNAVVDVTVYGAQNFNYTCWYALNNSGNLSAVMTDCNGNPIAQINRQ